MKTLILAGLLLMQADKPYAIAKPGSTVYHTANCAHYLTCKTCSTRFDSKTAAENAGLHICPFTKKAGK